jgi:hypothetical protein
MNELCNTCYHEKEDHDDFKGKCLIHYYDNDDTLQECGCEEFIKK